MRGGFLPPGMLCLALGLALAFVPLRLAVQCALLLVVAAVGVWTLAPPASLIEAVFIGCWVSVIATAATTYLPRPLPRLVAYGVSLNAGLWAGAVVAVAGVGRDLVLALPLVVVFVLGRQMVTRGWSIALKVVASWLIAVATLAAMLPLTPTPGYVPDHME